MMKRVMSLVVLFCFSFNVFAASGTLQELEKSLDEYQYALTVEWDQKDQKFHEAQTKAFFQKLSAMMVTGLKKEEVLALAEKRMQNKQALEALKLKLNVLTHVKSADELARLLSQNSKEFYAKGASWNGSVDVWTVLGGLAIAAILGYAVWFAATHECVAWGERWECSSDTYYDDYGSYTDTTCGWKSYCTQWVKSN